MKYRLKKHFDKLKSFSKKNKDNFKLLITKPSFIEDLNIYRNKLNIPHEGFNRKNKENKIFDTWELSIFRDINLENYYLNEPQKLVKKYNLSSRYTSLIRNYLLFNEIIFIDAQPFVEIRSKNINEITLNFYSQLTDEDWPDIKRIINEHPRITLPKLNKLKDIDFDLMVEKRYDSKTYNDHETEKEYETPLKDIAEDISQETGRTITAEDVYDISKRIKKLRESKYPSDK